MHQLEPSPALLEKLPGQTAIVTGAARGIGAAAATVFNKHGANVIIADLPHLRETAETLIKTLEHPDRAVFIPTDVTEWKQMVSLFEDTISKFGRLDMVVANAGVMETSVTIDMELDEDGKPLESQEALRVLNVNLKGTLNTLRLGLHYLSKNDLSKDGSRGSVTLVTSTSAYFGFTGNAAYVASKHGAVGLLRSCQKKATELRIRVNSIAPFYTPTFITSSYDHDGLVNAGVDPNTPEMVGVAIAYAAVDETRQGTSCLVAGKYLRELEHTQKSLWADWIGDDLVQMMASLGKYLASIGGYRLPPKSSSS